MIIEQVLKGLLGQGMTDAEIAAELGVTSNQVRKRRWYLNLPPSPRPTHLKGSRDDQQISRWYFDDSVSVPEIAQRLGCSPSRVYTRLQKMKRGA